MDKETKSAIIVMLCMGILFGLSIYTVYNPLPWPLPDKKMDSYKGWHGYALLQFYGYYNVTNTTGHEFYRQVHRNGTDWFYNSWECLNVSVYLKNFTTGEILCADCRIDFNVTMYVANITEIIVTWVYDTPRHYLIGDEELAGFLISACESDELWRYCENGNCENANCTPRINQFILCEEPVNEH